MKQSTDVPNFEQLRTFVTFAETRNFVRAAEALHVAQPTVHAQVKKLTEHYGVALYVREGRGLMLTAAGERVRAFGLEVLGRAERFRSDLLGTGRARPAVVAADEGTWLHLLTGLLGDAPDVRPSMASGLEVVDRVRRGEADVGVLAGDRPPGMETFVLRAVPQLLVVWSDHPLAGRERVDVTDLADVRLVAPPSGGPRRARLDAVAEASGVRLDVAVEVHGWPLTLRFVERGLGAAVVNGVCEMPSGLVGVPVDGLPVVRYRVFRRPGALRSPAASATWDRLRG